MIRKALIPIAGLGTRLGPLTKVVPKAMLPLPAGDRGLLPVVHWICSEAAAAGVGEVLLIVSPWQVRLLRDYLESAGQGHLAKLPGEIQMVEQTTPDGFGDAVARGQDLIGDQPFMLLLGDHVYTSGPDEVPCAAQVAAAFEKFAPSAMIGTQPVGSEQLPYVGVVGGEPIAERVYRCRDFIEKPDLWSAHRRLVTPGLPEGEFLAHCGIYVFSPEIFDCLAVVSRRARAAGKEVQLADAQLVLLERHAEDYLLFRINGRAHDTGTPASYAAAVAAFAQR